MSELLMKTYVLGVVMTNCYIISSDTSKEAIVIDPGAEAEKILNYLTEKDLVCKGILLTHGHFDHIMAVKELANITQANVYAHEVESELLQDANKNCSSHIRCEYGLVPDVLLKDGEIITLAGLDINVIHTPGHTAGGVCYYFKEHEMVITGDTLFHENIGRTDLQTGNGPQLVNSIIEKLMILEDGVKVYPGHGDPTTIGHERRNNFYCSAL